MNQAYKNFLTSMETLLNEQAEKHKDLSIQVSSDTLRFNKEKHIIGIMNALNNWYNVNQRFVHYYFNQDFDDYIEQSYEDYFNDEKFKKYFLHNMLKEELDVMTRDENNTDTSMNSENKNYDITNTPETVIDKGLTTKAKNIGNTINETTSSHYFTRSELMNMNLRNLDTSSLVYNDVEQYFRFLLEDFNDTVEVINW